MRLFIIAVFLASLLNANEVEKQQSIDDDVLIKNTILLAHKQNYVQFLSYDFQKQIDNRDDKEASFQISVKRELFSNIFDYDISFYAAFTQKSFWQIYDDKNSRPFRETNYNPEIFLSSAFSNNIQSHYLKSWNFGLEHESNGQSTATSRSWDRAYVKFFLKKDNFRGDFKLWNRFEEEKKKDMNDPHGDDNPDIINYYGNGETNIYYSFGEKEVGLFLRKNAFGIEITKLFHEKQYLFIKYFEGYGESLIDYDIKTKKLGFGLMLNK